MKARITLKNSAIVLRELRELDERTLQAAETGLRRGLLEAVSITQREFLSGPRPSKLDVVTTRLRNSISSEVKRVPGRGVIGRIGSNVKYAAFHEFGFHGVINVKSHQRVIEVFGKKGGTVDPRRAILDKAGNVIGFKESKGKAARRRGLEFVGGVVKSHTRNVNYAGKPFVRPALKKATPRILEAIRAELRIVTQGNK